MGAWMRSLIVRRVGPQVFESQKKCRTHVFIWLLPVCIILSSVSCSRTENSPEGEGSIMTYPTPTEAVVVSVSVYRHEIREGMRKVDVTVEVKGAAPHQVRVVEWVPVVLLHRLEAGRTVRLISDPREEGRVTLGL